MKRFEMIELEYVDGGKTALLNVSDLKVSQYAVEFLFESGASKVVIKDHVKEFYAFPVEQVETPMIP